MKTNVVMKSADRVMFGITIRQETKTGFLNLSDLQEAYTRARIQNGWMNKNVTQILQGKENVERLYYLLNEQGLIKVQFCSFMEEVDNNGITKTLKKYNAYKTTGARQTKTTFCNPYIWVLLAMELSPVIYAKVVTWLTDDLIINRIEAGNFCKALNKSIMKFNPDGNQYMTLAKSLNYIVFGKHEAGIRNTGTKQQLKELEDIEKKFAFAIDMGYITTWDQLLSELHKIWENKNNQLILH